MAGRVDTSSTELVTHHFVSLLPWLLLGVRSELVRHSEELPATLCRAEVRVTQWSRLNNSLLYPLETLDLRLRGLWLWLPGS